MQPKTDVIMDGRDIGTCVLPDAQVKIYLTASVATQRQSADMMELTAKGTPVQIWKRSRKILKTAITGICTGRRRR